MQAEPTPMDGQSGLPSRISRCRPSAASPSSSHSPTGWAWRRSWRRRPSSPSPRRAPPRRTRSYWPSLPACSPAPAASRSSRCSPPTSRSASSSVSALPEHRDLHPVLPPVHCDGDRDHRAAVHRLSRAATARAAGYTLSLDSGVLERYRTQKGALKGYNPKNERPSRKSGPRASPTRSRPRRTGSPSGRSPRGSKWRNSRPRPCAGRRPAA